MSFVSKWGFSDAASTFPWIIKNAPRGSYLQVEEPVKEYFDQRWRSDGNGYLFCPVRMSKYDQERRVTSA